MCSRDHGYRTATVKESVLLAGANHETERPAFDSHHSEQRYTGPPFAPQPVARHLWRAAPRSYRAPRLKAHVPVVEWTTPLDRSPASVPKARAARRHIQRPAGWPEHGRRRATRSATRGKFYPALATLGLLLVAYWNSPCKKVFCCCSVAISASAWAICACRFACSWLICAWSLLI